MSHGFADNKLVNATRVTTVASSNSIWLNVGGSIRQILVSAFVSDTASLLNPTERVVTKSGTYTLTSSDNIVNADTDTAGADIAINLGPASDYWDSTNLRTNVITVKNTGATDDAIVTPSTETIDGASSITIGPGASAEIYTDGSNFFARGL